MPPDLNTHFREILCSPLRHEGEIDKGKRRARQGRTTDGDHVDGQVDVISYS